jgi:hypothetical protein
VADGNVHRIPKGMGERIQAAMGLSMEQLSRYRALLKMTDDEQVNDALWTRSDVESWAEGAIREAYTLPIGKVRAVVEREQWASHCLGIVSTNDRIALLGRTSGEVCSFNERRATRSTVFPL